MSGHSKWAQIKRKKGVTDQKRGALFSKLAKEIVIAAKSGGGNPDGNARLRTAIDRAKAASMPNENIKQAILRGSGQLPGQVYEEISYEGIGPGGIAIMVRCLTDSRNRSSANIRHIFTKSGGNLGKSGSVSYLFQFVGLITISREKYPNEDEVMEAVLTAGADDMETQDDLYQIKTKPGSVIEASEALTAKGINCESAESVMLPNTFITPSIEEARSCMKLIQLLEEDDDVQNVYSNLEPPLELLAEE